MKKLLFIIFCLTFSTPALAQQTIFNAPSAEVAQKGRIFTQGEFQFRPWKPGRFMLNTDYFAVGIGHNTELDMTLFNVQSPASNNITLGTGFKSAIPLFKEKLPKTELKAIIGTEVLASLEGNGAGNWSYAALSGRVPKVNTRLTAGVSYGTKDIFGVDTVAFIGGVEQPITKNFGLQADWYSGKEHFAGFFIPGFYYAFPKDVTLYAGYQIPNSSKNGVSGFVIELAKLLP
ncbi:MAG TPA: hypothetical protein P5556_06635 [Candidatus Gastranaerophilales bacterium]|nr:hypothetical protein [Candidatus Gastranaerophilales bacterium]